MWFSKNNLLRVFIGILFLVLAFGLVFVWFGGGYFDSLGVVIALMLPISFMEMIVPASVWLIKRKYLSGKKGVGICVINSLVLFTLVAIWPVITIIKNEPCRLENTVCEIQFSWKILRTAAILAALYCLANICFFVDFGKTKKQIR